MAESKHSCIGQTFCDRICFWGETEPDTPAFIFRSKNGRYVLSRGDVLDLSSRFAFRLTELGVQPGDVVCIALPNCPERIIVDFGVHLAGAVTMNGQILSSDGQDIIESMCKSKCKMLVADPDQENGAWSICKQRFQVVSDSKHASVIKSKDVPSLVHLANCRTRKPESEFLTSLPSNTFISRSRKSSDIASIFATSGSTGYSKLVQHTHKALLLIAHRLRAITGISGKEDVSFTTAPLGWIGGFPAYFLYSGSPTVMIDDAVGGEADMLRFVWNIICDENVSFGGFASFQLIGILRRRDLWESAGKKLKKVLTGGQPLKKDCLEAIGHLTDSILNFYASTEIGAMGVVDLNESSKHDFKENMTGYPVQGVEIRVVDSELNEADGETRGEIIVRSETLTDGYIGDTGNMASFLTDGWFRMDDVGYVDAKGLLSVEGRSSDAIMHGAYILYPTWLEEKLDKCPGVEQLFIVPVPDKVLHQEICACVKRNDGSQSSEEDILNFAKAAITVNIPSTMNVVPKYVVFFETFPVTKTLKLNRKELAKLARERLQL
ncbi:3-[(3aS,4S,7aS)-7a-methyl-1,5-dioxo-octahydro-1H-inden-4-yl]propanoyl:CoA ligase-like [Haliotis cracherodii]|uniref:3-[(3aS,4S,7aS)-7a-methyl-1, 5-dioxo-octahydro-1H-inden-4-yl]propanoyl:CoA ligase-like n=1 Tax=Haliotis cracherodii TaxID=6455 RepID=UPI0039ED85DD